MSALQLAVRWQALPSRKNESGLTLVEILVSSTLLLFIVLGLTAMFAQTQRAFRGGVKQVDVLEGGRVALSMIARDFERAIDPGTSNVINFYSRYAAGLNLTQSDAGQVVRVNKSYDVFTLLKNNGEWKGIGYVITNAKPGLGSLHRFEMPPEYGDGPGSDNNMLITYSNQVYNANYTSNFNRVIDGVIHFQVNALDSEGLIINTNAIDYYPTNSVGLTNPLPRLPSAFEIELGVLEPQIVEQARGMPDPAALKFLQERPNKVHIFRQLVPIRPAR